MRKNKVNKMNQDDRIICDIKNKSLEFINNKLVDYYADILITKNINYEIYISIFICEENIYNETFILESFNEKDISDMDIRSLMIILLNNKITKIILLDMCINNRDLVVFKPEDLNRDQKKEIINIINEKRKISLSLFNLMNNMSEFKNVYYILNLNLDIDNVEEKTLIKMFSSLDIDDIPCESEKTHNKKLFKLYLEKILENKVNKLIKLKDLMNLNSKLNLDKNYIQDECYILIKKIFQKLYPFNNFEKLYKKEIVFNHISEEYGIMFDLLSLIKNETNEVEYLKKILNVAGLSVNFLKINQRLIELNKKNINIILEHSKKNKLCVVLDEKDFCKILRSNIKLKQKKELIDLIVPEHKELSIVKEIMEQYNLKEELKYF